MADVAPVVFKKRTIKGATTRRRAATPPPDSSGSEYSSEDDNGTRVKRRRKGGLVATAVATQVRDDVTNIAAVTANRTTTINNDDDATRQSNWFDADIADSSKQSAKPVLGTGGYSGQTTYSDFLSKNPDAPKRSMGPVKGPTNIRTITVTDFAPDVCKDYKQTGFCGFGDSCKFLHAREDYKQGWQIDKEWEKNGNGQRPVPGKGSLKEKSKDEDSILKDIPFACIICKGPYKSPVVTKCGHYFCQSCALARHKTKGGKSCAACKADTGGTFSVARKLNDLLDKKRERKRAAKEEARANGEVVSSDDENL